MSSQALNLAGKTAIITGAGRGIGKAIALKLAEAGADIVPVSRTLDEIEAVAEEARRMGRQALPLTMDVTKQDDIDSMVEKAVAKFSKIDILINNAGVTVKKPSEDVTEEDWDRILNTNLKGVFFCAQKVGMQMIKQNKGAIVNMASIASRVAITNSVVYCVSKGGVLQLTRVLAIEWAKHNIRVNAIGPAYIETPLTAGLLNNPELLQTIKARTPMGRIGKPDEISEAALFLASDAASYITGEILYIDGGLNAYGI